MKKRAAEFSTTFNKQEHQLKELQDKFVLRGVGDGSSMFSSDDDSDEERRRFGDDEDDEAVGLVSSNRGNSKSYRQKSGNNSAAAGAAKLTNAEKALRKGYAVSDLARNAM